MRAPRLGYAALGLLLVAGCDAGTVGSALSPSPTRPPVPTSYRRPRPPGEPVYFPLVFAPPPPGSVVPDLRFRMRILPSYAGLRLGDRFTIELTATNRDARAWRGQAASASIGSAIGVRVVRAPGGRVLRMCDHDATGAHVCRDSSVEWSGLAYGPGQVRTLLVEAEITGFGCPGGGDFSWEVSAGLRGPLRRESGGGRHLLWFENDPDDYVRARAARGGADTTLPTPVCFSESIEE